MGKKNKSRIFFFKDKKDKEIKYSVSLKLTLIVCLLSIIIIFTISTLNFYIQMENEENLNDTRVQKKVVDFAKSHSILKTIEDYISKFENFNNTQELQYYITNLTNEINTNNSKNTNIIEINIYRFEEGKLKIYASTDEESIGSISNSEFNNESFQKGDSYYIVDENNPVLSIISPINISGKTYGTYEIVMLTPGETLSYEEQIKIVILVSFIGIITLVFSLLYLLRKIIVNPITDFKEKSKNIGKGNLNTRVDIESNDEIGELADAFNQMAKDLKESRDKIEDYNQILENLLDQKDGFIGQLGHDLKNPLQPLVGLLPMLIDQEKDPKKKETLKLMNKNVEYMKDLIFDTLKLAKLRSENIEYNFETLNLKKISEDVISSQDLILKEQKIKPVNKISNNILVEADKLRLSEVFKNLINNSVKYTEKGGKIILDAEEDKTYVTVSITDTGIGMTEEQVKQVFDDFYKVDRQTSDYYSTGLGLAISKRIVKQMGGKIWVESKGPGKGSTFYFTLKNKTKNK